MLLNDSFSIHFQKPVIPWRFITFGVELAALNRVILFFKDFLSSFFGFMMKFW